MRAPLQFSLPYFTRLFSYCIDRSEKADDVPTRLGLLSAFVTRFIFNNVSRGAAHMLLVSPPCPRPVPCACRQCCCGRCCGTPLAGLRAAQRPSNIWHRTRACTKV